MIMLTDFFEKRKKIITHFISNIKSVRVREKEPEKKNNSTYQSILHRFWFGVDRGALLFRHT